MIRLEAALRSAALAAALVLSGSAPAGVPEAAPLPVRTQTDIVVRGGDPRAAKATVDTTLLMGPTGSGAPHVGDFEAGWNGWTSVDNTAVLDAHWQVSDYGQAVPGDLAALCGDPTLPACPEFGDVVGGYGNGWREVLAWSGDVGAPSAAALVRIQADLHIDVETDYDFVYLSVRREGARGWQNVRTWTGRQDIAVDWTITYEPAEFLAGAGVQVAFRFESDYVYSDEDCLFPTAGALQLDDVTVTISQDGQADLVDTTGFQDGTFGAWSVETAENVGDFARRWFGLEDNDPCASNYTAQVAFVDDGLVVPGTGGTFCLTWCYGPNGFIVTTTGGLAGPSAHIENHILSPVLTLPAGAGEGVLLAFDEYVHEDLSADAPGIFSMWGVRSADTDGSDGPPQVLADQAFSYDGLLGYGRASYRRREVDLTSRLGPGADEIQVRLGVLELGWMWGWTGDDGYPAPYFDNVAVKVFPYAGPAMSALEHQLAGDAFPEQDALTYGDPGAMNVRFDMAARSLSPLGTVPRDSIVAEVVPRRAGSVLLGPPQLHYLIDANPTFDPYRTTPTSGAVDGWPVTSAGGTAIAGAWAFDLPDTGTLYPGDVLHYYIRARDDVAGDVAVATLPADLAGFGDFSQPAAYDRRFTVDALPGIRDESGTGAWTAPKFLYWDDGGSAAAHDTWLAAIEEAGFDAYDVFVTASASSNLLSGLGAATSGACLAPYEAIVYSSGTLYETIGDGDATFGHGSDIAALEIYLAGGNRGLLVTGDEMASDLAWDRGAAGAAFLADVVGLEVLAGDLRPFISGQVVPQVGVIPGNPALGLLDAWVAYGGCPALNTFDAVEVRPGTDRLAEFLDPAGNGGVYTYAAAAARLSVNGNVVASLPYDLAFVYTSQEWPPVPYRNARSLLLEDLLRYMSVLPPECPNGDCPPVPDLPAFAVHCAPNPFNPATRLSYTVPASGHLSLKIYDLRGRLVRTVLDEQVTADGSVVWDGRDADGAAVASGVYFTEARLNGEVRVGKVALIK